MELEQTRTTEGQEGESITQFSVFLQNRVGALLDLVKLLNDHHIEVIAFSVQDSADASVTRMIVSDPDLVQHLFRAEEMAFNMTKVLVVELPEAADLASMLTCILQAEANISFSYPLMIRPQGLSALVLHVEDKDCVSDILKENQFKLLTQADISR